MFTGKRTERMRIPTQVNVDPAMSQIIKARAGRRLRSVGNEIVHLIIVGLLHDPEQNVYEHLLLNQHVLAPPRKVTHINSQERKMA